MQPRKETKRAKLRRLAICAAGAVLMLLPS